SPLFIARSPDIVFFVGGFASDKMVGVARRNPKHPELLQSVCGHAVFDCAPAPLSVSEDDVRSALRTWWVSLFAACSALAAKSDASSSADALVGLWGYEQIIGPWVAGELTVDARGPEWRARIAGYDVALKRQGDRLEFALPGSAGELRALLAADGKAIIRQWIQTAHAIYNNLSASPVVLARVTPKVWRGQVVPLEQRISFYVWVQRAADGSLTASIRNPEFNWFRRRTYSVKLENGAVLFTQDQQQVRGS